MLSELSIENFAIIDHLLLRFSPGFTVLTGETGAGKSIIIDALQTALGARVGADVLRGNARFAAVEAVFDRGEAEADDPVASILQENGIEDDGCLILRREINPSGRSTARINGRAVPLSVLSSVGSLLVDIHGQSDHLSILRRDRQLDVLDRYGDLLPLRAEVAAAIKEYTGLHRRLEEVRGGQREAVQRLDLLRFQVQEIESAQLKPGEEQELEAERNLLSNAERLTGYATSTYESLQGESGGALDGMYAAVSSMRELSGIDQALTGLAERLEAAQYEVEDIAQEVRQYRDSVESDPQRLDAIETRLDLLLRLRRKYGATIEEVIAFGQGARAEMEDVENLDERIEALEGDLAHAQERAGALADELSAARSQAAESLTRAMHEALQGLGLKGTEFAVELTQTEAVGGLPLPDGRHVASSLSGIDTATFLVSFNPGEPLRPLEKVASGGETSRFLLALKSVLAGADRTSTLVFDEVDVGVGGRAGTVVGERLRLLSRSHQVLSITHLPQVAALADQHARVVKVAGDGRTSVDVQSLDSADRVLELAEMMSGAGTEAARRSAEELLEAAQRSA